MATASAILLGASPAMARMPPNPDRLATVVDCKSALRELVGSAQGNPLRGAAETKRYVDELARRADQYCVNNPALNHHPK
jgi:hypothetical protein